jgi:2-keto-4-pentenoate hydratase/2-oxohepta-3-ene-1,7-dioic acid hydratase in catechol pathway
MRLLTVRWEGVTRLVVQRGDGVVDLTLLGGHAGPIVPASMQALIDSGTGAVSQLSAALEAAGELPVLPFDAVDVLAPIEPRGNVLAIGHNYAEHAKESAAAQGKQVTRPTVFTKSFTSINTPYGDVRADPAVTKEVDWEVELGVVLGRTAYNVPREEALSYVFGYTVINDISARDIQFGWGGQFFKGKSLDTFCPIGPAIVTADEIPDPQNLHLVCRVNGEVKQDSWTSDMIFPVDELIAQLSLGMTLPSGTVIATGTPAGVGFARDPKEFLQPGDVVESEIEGIGTLRNRIVEP